MQSDDGAELNLLTIQSHFVHSASASWRFHKSRLNDHHHSSDAGWVASHRERAISVRAAENYLSIFLIKWPAFGTIGCAGAIHTGCAQFFSWPPSGAFGVTSQVIFWHFAIDTRYRVGDFSKWHHYIYGCTANILKLRSWIQWRRTSKAHPPSTEWRWFDYWLYVCWAHICDSFGWLCVCVCVFVYKILHKAATEKWYNLRRLRPQFTPDSEQRCRKNFCRWHKNRALAALSSFLFFFWFGLCVCLPSFAMEAMA